MDNPEIARSLNLGPVSAEMLRKIGIENIEQLRAVGAVPAYKKLIAVGLKPSLNLLYAMEGALTGQSWQTVAREKKLTLLLLLESSGHE